VINDILKSVSTYVRDKECSKTWTPGEDWVQYSGPYYDEKEYVAAIDSLLSGWFIMGKTGRLFEDVFPEYLGKTHGVMTNSGSSANLLMYSVLKCTNTLPEKYLLPEGSKFITPIVCFPTTINPMIQNGFEPVFVDVELPSLNLNLDHVEQILESDHNREIKGIVFAHVLGNPPDMDRVMQIVEKYNLVFLEDSCDALGSTYRGKKLGSFGDISTCSFFPAHHMTTGEGGFVATDQPIIRRALASIRDWGRACYCNDKKPGDVTAGTACGDRFKKWFKPCSDFTYDHRYVFSEIGYNVKPLELQAAIGLEQVKKLPVMEQARKDNYKRLTDIFKPYEKYLHLSVPTPNSDPCWFGYLLTVKDNDLFTKNDLTNMFQESKVQTRSYFTGNALYHPAYKSLREKFDYNDFPIANIATRNSIFLGTYIGITEEKCDYIKTVVDKFFATYNILL
jgi:CDP-6-deoxy-D-xylo-4-hexulose-3-dehydrase